MVAKKADVKIKAVAVPLEWHVPEGVMTPFASNMVVQFTEGMFKLSFFEIKPPIQFGSSPTPPSSIRADMVASVFILPDKIPTMLKTLGEQLDKYNARMKQK